MQQLNREEKLEVLSFLKAELADEESYEWDDFLRKQGGVGRIPSVKVDFRKAKGIQDTVESCRNGVGAQS